MKQSTEDRASGKVHEVKGKIKEKVGQLTNNRDLEAEGIGERIGGKVKKKIGQVEKALGK
ncbi:MAG TPA: CsbD family protein [Pyrinomonadaceae bacterium]|jgi:CsbD-like.|nr:CsbD family protein [Pyrinomonadaceae bacterium]